MAMQKTNNFSHDLKTDRSVEGQIEKIAHPLVKQILTDVLSEETKDSVQGSAFGEGGGAG